MSADHDSILQYMRDGRFAEAERACRDGLDGAAGEGLLTLLGVCQHRQGRSDEALETFRLAVRREPEAVEPLNNLAVLLQLLDRQDEAERAFRRLLLLHPSSPLAHRRLALRRQTLGDSQGAAAILARAIRSAPGDAGDLFNYGILMIHSGRPAEAVLAFSAQLVFEPGNPGAWTQLGGACLPLGRVRQAGAAFRRASLLSPTDGEACNGAARAGHYQGALAAAGDPERAEGLPVRGPLQGLSGYAHMTNRLVGALRRGGAAVHVMGLLGTESWVDPVTAVPRSRAVLNCLTPPTVEPVPGLATINFSMFEGTRIPAFWSGYSAMHDLVIVPTRSSWTAWAERGFPQDRLRLCPLGVDPEAPAGPILTAPVPGGRPLLEYRHRFLNVSDFIPRKNVDGLLRVWLRTTTPSDDAVLILKLGKGNAQTRAAIQALFRETEAAVGKRLDRAAPVVVVDQGLDEVAMTALFRAATHYWSLSHGEGWDLPMTQAGAMGLTLIAPRHSAYAAYLDDEIALMLPTRPSPGRQPYVGLEWWSPDEVAAVDTIARIVRNGLRPAGSARDRLIREFSWERSGERLVAVLRDLGVL